MYVRLHSCRLRVCAQEDVNAMLFVVHQDTLKKDKLVNKMSELNLHLEQANRQYYIDRGRKQVVDPAAGKVTVGLVSRPTDSTTSTEIANRL